MARVDIRRMTGDDREAVGTILSAAFAGLNAVGIAERELALAPGNCWIAEADGTAAGLVCGVRYGRIAYIGPMGVSPAQQGKGIGTLLLRQLIGSLEADGSETMLLDATNAGEPLYRKFGFLETGRTYDMSREPGPGIQIVPRWDGLEDALALDRKLYGADRSAVFRRLLENEGAALFSRPGGYLVSQTKVLGPFAAAEARAAEELLDLALGQGAVAGRVLAPVENADALQLLTARGFKVQRGVKQMGRGKPAAIRRELIYGLASFALG